MTRNSVGDSESQRRLMRDKRVSLGVSCLCSACKGWIWSVSAFCDACRRASKPGRSRRLLPTSTAGSLGAASACAWGPCSRAS